MAKTYENSISNDLARLKGARLVMAVEANFNRQLDEAKIKAMTGGEPITARFMRQEYFSFQPEFKLWITANDFPRVRGTAESFWRRVVVIPFTRVVPEKKRDKRFSTLLREEFPGILTWLVAGCREWQKNGLRVPGAVQNATGLWRKDADHVLKFTSEECLADPAGKVAASVLYDCYTKWCRKNGETPLSMALLKSKLITLNFTRKRSNRGSEWMGVKVRAE
jgi:putative DNA primase/helicase